MSEALAAVHLTEDSAPPGLVPVCEIPQKNLSLDEQIAIRSAYRISNAISHIFFRRFSNGRASQVAAYVVKDADCFLTEADLSELHHKLWLSGSTPLLYVERENNVDIFSCAAEDKRNKKSLYTEWLYSPEDTINTIAKITSELEKCKRYSAFRLADGTFWEDARNVHFVNPAKAAHNGLIEEVKKADEELGGKRNPLARRLLLLTIFIKYLEDRKVFDCENGPWFSQFCSNAKTFIDVLEFGSVDIVQKMFCSLKDKFNGDIFNLPKSIDGGLDAKMLRSLSQLVRPNCDTKGQFYFWDIYSFEHIPVEVLSHIYQHFADKGVGAVFTPPMVVSLLLEQAMPYRRLTGEETIFDPTCGSGIFLVGAFRKLVQVWSARHGWQRPSPERLKNLLSHSIFGVEYQEEAAGVAAFSLSLAVCDALQPNIIWNKLKFDKLIGTNILVGDFEEKAVALNGDKRFDIIIGNPPFLSKLTKAMVLADKKSKERTPHNQTAYFILKQCLTRHLANSGRLCMIQPAGFLYNENTKSFRENIFKKHQVDAMLDFISIRGLFSGADVKVIAILARQTEPELSHEISHLTFRRTSSTKGRIQFELDFYDYNSVCQEDAISLHWPWRVNLLGGGRLYHMVKRLSLLPTLKEVVQKKGWLMREGFIAGDPHKGQPAQWLTGKRFLPVEALTLEGVDNKKISKVSDTFFASPRSERNFKPPIFLIRENHELPSIFWNKGDIAYMAQIVGIRANDGEEEDLRSFAQTFEQNRDWLKMGCYLLGTRLFTSKATSVLKKEIDRLPWPNGCEEDAAQWEKELKEDLLVYMADFLRLGQKSELLSLSANRKDLNKYTTTFLRILRPTFPDIHLCGKGHDQGLQFMAFCFGQVNSVSWLNDNWLAHLRDTIFVDSGEASALRTIRLLRIYEDNTLILIKPDRLRYWIRSTAIRDVDSILSDIMLGGPTHA